MGISQVTWRKASYSGSNGGGCVEVASTPAVTVAVRESVGWRKASYSTSNGGGCVEAASIPAAVAVRDSRDPDGPALAFASPGWQAFTSRIKDGTLRLG